MSEKPEKKNRVYQTCNFGFIFHFDPYQISIWPKHENFSSMFQLSNASENASIGILYLELLPFEASSNKQTDNEILVL